MPARARRGCVHEVTSRPANITRPCDAGSSPARRLTSVDLPAPLVPMTACTLPTSSAIDTQSTAVNPPKRRVRSVAARMGSDGIGMARWPDAPELRGQTDKTVRHQADAGDDGETEQELPMLGETAENRFRLRRFLQEREGERAEHGTAQAADAAENDHEQHATGLMPRQQFRIDITVLHGIEKSGDAGERAGDDECGQLVGVG